MTSTTTTGRHGSKVESISSLKLNDGNEVPMVRAPNKWKFLVADWCSLQLSYGFSTANFRGKNEDISRLASITIKNRYYHPNSVEGKAYLY